MKWECKKFDELSLSELYKILKLRQEIFVVEQDCAYLDVDGYDADCLHILGKKDNRILAYARLVAPGAHYKEASFGRVLTKEAVRGTGLGKKLVAEIIQFIETQYNTSAIRIMAQCYLVKFYEDFGFVEEGASFLEDGIPHVEMLKLNNYLEKY